MNKKIKLAYWYFLIVITLAFLVYLPGVYGGFLFDDYPNLGEMTKYGDLHNWDNARHFILNGFSGPTGRPIALASFWLTFESWPLNPQVFKFTNIIIHLICGILLFIVMNMILISYGYLKEKAIWVSLLAASLWLLHPFFVSTTLYVVQRMTQLSMLFSLLGIIGYLHGRKLLNLRPVRSYIFMTVSICFATVLATYSKENGILLPLLILIIEFCNPVKSKKPILLWRFLFLGFPSVVIIGILLSYIDLSGQELARRNFTQLERFLSEGRVLCDYLIQIFIPRIEGYGLYQDGFLISKSLFSPVTTFISFSVIAFLLIFSVIIRRKIPLLSLAILLFFSGHLIESTIINLELYFEHRNYFPAAFLFLPCALGIYNLNFFIKTRVVIFISVLILVFLAMMSLQRSILWSDSEKLKYYWAEKSLNSPRAQSFMAQHYMAQKSYEKANQVLIDASRIRPDSGLLAFQLLLQKIAIGSVSHQDFASLNKAIPYHDADIQAMAMMQHVVLSVLDNPELIQLYGDDLIFTLDALIEVDSSYLRVRNLKGLVFFSRAQIFAAQKKPQEAYVNYKNAFYIANDVGDGIVMVTLLANAGYQSLALELLNHVDLIYKKQSDKSLKRTRSYYDKEIVALRNAIKADILND
ncbi:tetratricopeptide repeat protein [Acinetobacter zhairhuonensis]|uniref:tetratricopeptide repeat protein n=1 Tax=Acinetobacter sp. A7.4 TaxID=2919921 RepID=UPI001F4F672E|nr:hypothetical protein [Acinetobacter sp. A7.4]MCJ8161416.1 hypothetical protein [Acinetobacter sp. A7.4]